MTIWGAEVRLKGAEPLVALGAMVPRDEAQHLSVWTEGRTEPAWNVFRSFCERWANPATRLHATVPRIFLETDVIRTDAPPCTFLTLEDLSWQEDPALSEILFEAFLILRGGDLAGAARDKVLACIDVMPRSARLLHAGAMLCRPGVPLRLSVWCPRDQLEPYLEATDCTIREDSRAVLAYLIGASAGHLDCQLEIDGTGKLADRVGIEISFGADHQDPRWVELFQFLEAAGLSERGRLESVMKAQPKLRLSHVKVSLGSAQPPSAKAYLTA